MRKKDGFTLIELLAVIVILAIIALIAIPQIMKILNQARVSAAEDSTYGVYNATQDYVSRLMLDNGGDFPSGELTFTCDNTSCKLDNYATLVSEGYNLEETLDYKGKKATGGTIKITDGGKDIIIEDLIINGFTCNYSDGKATCEKDTPVVTKSFAEDDWNTIIKAVKKGKIDNYNVGDTKTIEMDVDGNGTKEIYTLRIANTSTPDECSTEGFSQTACGFVLEFVDLITRHQMNPYNYNDSTIHGTTNGFGNKGGWEYSEMRGYVNNDIYNLLPTEIKNAIIDTIVVSGHGPNDSNNFTTTDKLYLLSTKEEGVDASYDTAKDNTRILDYYNANNNDSSRIKKYNNSSYNWWLRSATSYDYNNFYVVYSSGNGINYSNNANFAGCVAPAFRIG